MSRNPIIVALDVADSRQALQLAGLVGPFVGGFKIGKELFVAVGPSIVHDLRQQGALVFLDLKFHDIPQTVARAVASATRLGVQMLTVHASGGTAMMRAAVAAANATAQEAGQLPPLLLGVTVLTSLDSAALSEVGIDSPVASQVERLARLSIASGMTGLVCSPRELRALRGIVPSGVQLVTPGIRTGLESPDDQKRTLSPSEALADGADWLVVGRPIHGAPDPKAAASALWDSIRQLI
jgi:orotidine-5'-phosphate decarboxylase